MSALSLLQQALLLVHLIAFALAMSAVLREDLRLLRTRHVDAPRLQGSARLISIGLLALWISGLALVALEIAASAGPWTPSAKLLAKLFVVGMLTINGGALHAFVFPRLAGATVPIGRRWWPAALLGAVSTASWVTAAFVGAARPLAPWLSFAGFMVVYGAALCVSAAVALAALSRPALIASRRPGLGGRRLPPRSRLSPG